MPLIFNIENTSSAELAVWKIEETEEELLSMLRFTKNMTTALNRINHEEKRLEWLASRILIQKLSGNSPCVQYQENGSPELNSSEVNLSISHTKGYAAVIVSSQKKCGIDIEYPSPRVSKIAEKFISESEAAYIPVDEENKYNLLIWCAKETLFKTHDTPGLNFKKHLEISPFKLAKEGILKAKTSMEGLKGTNLLYYVITNNYYLVWHW